MLYVAAAIRAMLRAAMLIRDDYALRCCFATCCYVADDVRHADAGPPLCLLPRQRRLSHITLAALMSPEDSATILMPLRCLRRVCCLFDADAAAR